MNSEGKNSNMSDKSTRISRLPKRVQRDVLTQLWANMTSRYLTGWRYGSPLNDGELTQDGRDFLGVIGKVTPSELSMILIDAFRAYRDWPPTLNQIDALAIDIVARRPPEPERTPENVAPRLKHDGAWIDRATNGNPAYGAQMREACEANPHWEKRSDESSKEYGARMAAEIKTLMGGSIGQPLPYDKEERL